ncbi:Uncharacterized metalloprotease yggG [Suttonella ornithocola]|uniref:Uncharacterized metalloprotease yggG n=1 Tax=Suttonella ornithocola TaxID=279832 RepID=A0A380N0N8_9GAMM|nr:Uncharacterized metalloprotease yggG [Suttonella ornithocola]
MFNRLLPYAQATNQTGIPFHWQMHVIRANELNAWAMPGGKMVVYTGLVENLNLTDDEIAAIIGHEMTHALQEHSKQTFGQKVLTGLGTQIAGQMIQNKTGWNPAYVNLGGNILSQYGIDLPFSRKHEEEADIGGLILMTKAGYYPQAAISLWQKMNRNGAGQSPSFLSTHPNIHARIQLLEKNMPTAMRYYQQSTAQKAYR